MFEKIVSLCVLAIVSSALHTAAQSTNVPPPPAAAPAPPPPAAPVTSQASTIIPPTGSTLSAPPTLASSIDRLAKLSPLGDSPHWEALAPLAKTMSRADVETALRNIYTDGGAFPQPWRVEPGALIIQTGDPARPEHRIELGARSEPSDSATRFWHRVQELPPLTDPAKPLADLHIAIDPGHIGGGYSTMEERFLSFAPNEAVQEGYLTLITAQALAEELKALGAYVTLVRDRLEPVTKQRPQDLHDAARKLLTDSGFPQPKETYDGLTGDAKLLTVQWQAEKLFYRVSEIRARAKKVNTEIKPDLVLCLHYNAEAWGAATSPQFSPNNHFHILVNGCYSAPELEQADIRYEMFHRLLARVHEEELPLANAVAEGMRRITGLPAYIYTTPNARRPGTNDAVYARNLLANRLYDCPVVYLEPYVMNHEETYRRLLNGHFIGRTLIGGKLQTSVVRDYVRGVIEGLTTYYRTHRRVDSAQQEP